MGGIGVLGEAGQPHEGGGGELLLVAAPLLLGRGGGTGIRASAHWLRRVIYVGAERLPRAAQLTGQPTGEWAMASATAFQAAMGWVRGAGAGGVPGPPRG